MSKDKPRSPDFEVFGLALDNKHWKAGADVNRIPNYRRELHEKLDCTIAKDARLPTPGEGLRIMACHYSTEQKNTPCAGWLHNQLGPGNNIAVRLAVMGNKMPVPKVVGRQKQSFEETLE